MNEFMKTVLSLSVSGTLLLLLIKNMDFAMMNPKKHSFMTENVSDCSGIAEALIRQSYAVETAE